jgi:hypothetical protein
VNFYSNSPPENPKGNQTRKTCNTNEIVSTGPSDSPWAIPQPTWHPSSPDQEIQKVRVGFYIMCLNKNRKFQVHGTIDEHDVPPAVAVRPLGSTATHSWENCIFGFVDRGMVTPRHTNPGSPKSKIPHSWRGPGTLCMLCAMSQSHIPGIYAYTHSWVRTHCRPTRTEMP